MASLKDVRSKISGVSKTKQITKAMNMVASAKLRGAQTRMEKFREYANTFHAMLQNLASRETEVTHPLMTPREVPRKVCIILITSGRGLCGGFNASLISEALKVARACKAEGKEAVFLCVGKKGRDAVRKQGFAVLHEIDNSASQLDFSVADRIGLEIINRFLRSDVDEVLLVYSEFKNMIRQIPMVEKLLPLVPQASEQPSQQEQTVDYLFEPAGDALLDALLPRVIKALVYRGLLETATSEHAARMTAMDNATRNCDELTASLTRLFNKTRQAIITSELIDIVGGVEALKG